MEATALNRGVHCTDLSEDEPVGERLLLRAREGCLSIGFLTTQDASIRVVAPDFSEALPLLEL